MKKNSIALYIHLPWCIRKCPYCDFNSHKLTGIIPEKEYIDRLIWDFKQQLPTIKNRQISSVFFGGGTPSLFSAESLDKLLTQLRSLISFSKNCEITLEANPGAVEQQRFNEYYAAGINRLSLGVQSFQDDKLKLLGRVHNSDEAKQAISTAKKSGFTNFNIDLMHGLPQQSINDAISDLQSAIDLAPTHISWYQLTIEPNTVFYKKTPTLPNEKTLEAIEQQGFSLLSQHNFNRYEVSAFSKKGKQSQHNMNYWQFGDYLGIGAGAHSKITNIDNGEIKRHWQTRQPKDYLNVTKKITAKTTTLTDQEKITEFMMNALRLYQPISFQHFEETTDLSIEKLSPVLKKAEIAGLISLSSTSLETTPLGKLFLNDVVNLFL